MQTEAIKTEHPAGEEDFAFRTGGGRVALRATDDALTPYGGLAPWAAFIRHTGIVEQLAETCQKAKDNALRTITKVAVMLHDHL